jgi:hypothetical protein
VIVDIVVEPAALLELSTAQIARASVPAQMMFIEVVQSHGAMVFSNQAKFNELAEMAYRSPRLNQNEQKRFSELLLFMSQRKRLVIDPEVAIDYLDLDQAAGLAGRTAVGRDVVLVMGSNHFDQTFPQNEAGIAHTKGISASLASTLAAVDEVVAKRSLAAKSKHPNGYSRESVWQELFAPIARHSLDVSIVDPYLFGEMDSRRKGLRRSNQQEHVAWLLSKLSVTSKLGTRVKLIGGYDEATPTKASDVMTMVLEQWTDAPGRIVELEIVLAARRDLPHNRHIRFGGLAFGLDDGLDRLRAPQLWDVDGINWKYLWAAEAISDLQAREKRVERSRTATAATRTF